MDNTVLFDLSYGVCAVTTWSDGRAVGCIANSVMQVTASPMTLAVSIHKDNYTHDCIRSAGKFAVSILHEKTDPAVIGAFGFHSASDPTVEKFAGIPQKIVSYLPVVADSCGCIVLELKNSFDCGSHTIFLGEVTDAKRFCSLPPMTYRYYHTVIKGKSPQNAPTYQPEQTAASGSAQYVCSVCGYVYDGDVPFEQLPASYVCPLCGVGIDQFEKKEETKMEAKYVCSVCGYVYDGDVPFEELPDDYVCPLCGVGKDMFEQE